ncbi:MULTISPECIES: DUF5610 domain-containing protein [unclassified Arsukibacterium]|uniref:DUF5610 domain-containing protein n=1 Tax=unclassified Arsukibacterium TaxID=2635278 RepID=UPI000C4AC9DE|nr:MULTISPECIES: DUF5610 domain-containing protein [unclassified Arsukibacterium]MAA96220.1 hypothetical protein [Rheinheimera sp.]MBM35033.1 hypothetical protein [Rheinheimera sp.]HAW92413.1 hypothetical protein [Candidatus Azambacteria bacterium]|tara:strand:+ start:3639 stop:4304 length:666 start_codon:yes stop_codon:yes gene_type:complete
MAIIPNSPSNVAKSNTPASATSQNNQTAKSDNNRQVKDNGVESDVAKAKQAQNVAILRANERVSLSSNNDSLSLLYKTALEGINAELEPVLGENAAQKVYDAGVDTSPEATAERIVAFVSGFYSRYKELNPGRSEEEQLDNFLNVIGPGIEKGFADAKDILKGLKVYQGEISEGVDQTYAKVISGLETFRLKMLERAEQAASNNDTDTPGEPDTRSDSTTQ